MMRSGAAAKPGQRGKRYGSLDSQRSRELWALQREIRAADQSYPPEQHQRQLQPREGGWQPHPARDRRGAEEGQRVDQAGPRLFLDGHRDHRKNRQSTTNGEKVLPSATVAV